MAGHRRASAAALLTVILATGCVDSGLPGKNLPLEEARHREWRYPLYQAAVQPSGLPDLIHFDGSTWALQAHGWPELGIATTLTRDPSMLEAVSGGAAAFQALRWDQAPYDRLFLRAPSGLREYERVY